MKTNKILRSVSVIFECSFIGCIILYAYNYYVSAKKYEIIPTDIKKNLNIFVIIAIISIILFLVIKYVLYLRNKPIEEKLSQLELNFNEFNTDNLEQKYKNLEAPVTERVIIYKDAYDVPKERQMECPNCKNIIDKNAYICIKCGYLLQRNEPKIIEKPVYIEKQVYNANKKQIANNINLKNILINIGLIICIIAALIIIINMAIERGIIK